MAEALRLAPHPRVGALWDLHHPYRQGESPEQTWDVLGPFVLQTHVKDSVPGGTYCLLGDGDIPIKPMLALLVQGGYDGWVNLEWEKRWIPVSARSRSRLPPVRADPAALSRRPSPMSAQTYAARWVLPMDAPPIENGEVVVEDGLIAAVRPRSSPAPRYWGGGDFRDFGEAALLPGLVNAHTHLEYTALRGRLEDVSFFPWVRALLASKSALGGDDWLWSARLGAMESVAAGTTTIGDNTDAGVTMIVAAETGLRAIIYQEVFGIDPRQPVPEIMADLRAKITAHRGFASERVQVGVSPHALYTVRPELIIALNAFVADENLPTSIHVAESPAESELTEQGDGPFAEMFTRRGIPWDVPHASPTQYAADLGALGPQALAVHCVQQTQADTDLFAATGAAIAHCPKSNAKLGAGIAPLPRWLKTEGLRVALGTDSAVSNNALDLWEEMRFALLLQRAARQDVEAVTAAQVLRLATLGGAEALGLASHTGSLTPGKRADMIAVELDSPHAVPATDPYAALVYSARADDVRFTLCDSVVLYDTGEWPTLDRAAVMTPPVPSAKNCRNCPRPP